MNAPVLSVVVCTHNPRADFLARTLAGLQAQTLPATDWELVIVDNASRDPLGGHLAIPWHPAVRVVREESVGLTSARLRGIAEARAAVIVFVDDDNILAPDYLAQAVAFAVGWPMLGAWGCGRFVPEWEEPPAPELSPFMTFLAVHTASRDHWSNRPYDYPSTPAGAGLCIRTAVARHYARLVAHDPRRQKLDRMGTGLAGCGDFDLVFTAHDLGLGSGVFTSLALTHLMPRSRVQPAYLHRLAEGHGYSSFLLHALRGGPIESRSPGPIARLRRWRYLRSLAPAERAVSEALARGEARARIELGKVSNS